LISSSRITSADASGPNSVMNSPVAGLGDELAGGRVDHLEPDDFGGLQVGPALQPREFGVADGRQNHPEEGFTDTGHPAQQQVAGVDLTVLVLVVGGRNLREEHDVGERLLGCVPDQGVAGFCDDGVVEIDRFLELWVHEPPWGK
jgi:hypothetical protein